LIRRLKSTEMLERGVRSPCKWRPILHREAWFEDNELPRWGSHQTRVGVPVEFVGVGENVW
jgi:hypothetical protein